MTNRLELSLDALRSNARLLRDLVAPSQLALVVKANAYGHGLSHVAKTVEAFASALCVFSVEEGLQLREAGVRVPIVVLGPATLSEARQAVEAGLELSLWDTGAYVRELGRVAERVSQPILAHLKIDTGLARLGLRPERLARALDVYAAVPAVRVRGIFSHLAAAEEQNSPYTMLQLQRFTAATESARFPNGQMAPIRHIAASAAAMLWPQTRLDMVRCGIALYGLWPSRKTQEAMAPLGLRLRPALAFRSRLAAIRDVDAATGVGYGLTYHTSRATRLGIVPAGYADGVPRLLSNRGAFLVRGRRCAVVGRVAMNMTTIDLGNLRVGEGEPVTLFGDQGDEAVTVDEWAEWSDTISYEILARLPARLRREPVAGDECFPNEGT